MLGIVFVLCLVCTLAKENFRFNATVAQCFNTSTPGGALCTLATGCCNGHGICVPNGGSVQCVCDVAPECGNSPYTGSLCNVAPSSCPSTSPCPNVTVCNLNWAWSQYGHLSGVDPERGAQGNLLVREAAALFADGFGSPKLWISTSNLTDDVNQMINSLGLSNTSVNLTTGNMMGLGLLEVALKDIVDFEYNYNSNVTLYGNTYPTVKWQGNTGQTGVPKQFANNATGIIDLGPLYGWAHRTVSRNITSPYLDLTDAIAHWSTTHHMSTEFLVALRFYKSFHYYVARNMEEYFCGQNSTTAPIASGVCTLINNTSQGVADWIYEQARRSTIRFSQSLLQQSVLQILSYHNSTDLTGYWEPIFEQYFRRDYPASNIPLGGAQGYAQETSVRGHQEWAGDVTRVSLSHHLISGLDFLISMRNPNTNTTAFSFYGSTCAAAWQNPQDPNLISDVLGLLYTPLQKYGSTVRSQYKADLAIQLYRASEIGLASYEQHILGLTNQSLTGLGGLLNDSQVYYGAQKETNCSRLYKQVASVAMASTVPISDAIIVDRVGLFSIDPVSQWWTANNYHPDPQNGNFQPDFDTYGYDYPDGSVMCYQSGGSCTSTSTNAAAVVLGYVPDMDDIDNYFGVNENLQMTRSNGATFACPGDASGMPFPSLYPDVGYGAEKSELRAYTAWRLVSEFANTLFYQYDGLNSLAVKEAQTEDVDPSWNVYPTPGHYLPQQIVDAIPTNIGWTSVWFDGGCFAPWYFSQNNCTRTPNAGYASAGSPGACGWYWQGP